MRTNKLNEAINDRLEQASKEDLEAAYRFLAGAEGQELIDRIFSRLHKTFRKILSAKVVVVDGSPRTSLVADRVFFSCAQCCCEMHMGANAHFVQTEENTLAGPLCDNCAGEMHRLLAPLEKRDREPAAYLVNIDEELLKSLAVWMVRLPDPLRVPKAKQGAFHKEEDYDLPF